ncbi:NAD(P)/FAD-dependent oxidoreductase [bacterium]|nr:NAD(P)/FAD-dependent oxidoreductase [bacterium]
MNSDSFYNFVIAGGGPAGLTAAITAAKNGFKAIVLEKGDIPGPRPRGESVRLYPLLEELLGKEFFKKKCLEMDGSVVYHSPGDFQKFKISSEQPRFFFEWRDFIDKLGAVAEEVGVVIQCNCRVIGPVRNSQGICIGVKYTDKEGKIHEVYGDTVLACDGHKSTLGQRYKIPYDTMNCPMVKCLATNKSFDIKKNPSLQFYIIGNGDLEYAPTFPQSVAYMFPIDDKKMELGLMLRMTHARKMKKTLKIPEEQSIMNVWNLLKKDYPGFSNYFKDSVIEVEEITGLSNARLVKKVIPGPGMVVIGDSAGFIDPNGSSGIYFSMAMADFWVNMLSKKLQELGGGRIVDQPLNELWSKQNIKFYNKAFEASRIYKKIKRSYFKISKFEWYVFKHLRTSDRINKRWELISKLMKIA